MTQPGTTPQQPVLGVPEKPTSLPPSNHGHTIASWTAMVLIMVGAVIALIGFVMPTPALAWTGLGVAVFGVLLGGVLRALGFGQPRLAAEDA